MSLPSVAKVNDQSNGLIVRGGNPVENAFFIDGIEVPNINHFPDQASSSGPIGMINVDLIKDVVFHSGAFPSVYGDRLSSVMDITLREGNRKEFDGQLDLNFAGFGGVAEGPLARGRGSWLISARRSYLDLVVKAFDVGSTVAPRYGDGQAKVAFDLNRNHSVSLIGFWGDDHNAPDRETGLENDMQVYGRQDIATGTAGLTWRALWGKNAVSRTSLSTTGWSFDEDWYETSTARYQIRNRSLEQSTVFRNVNHVRLDDGFSLEFGADVKSLASDYDNGYQGTTNALGDTVPPVRFDTRLAGTKFGLFADAVFRPVSWLTVEAGLRADRFTVNRNGTVSPRVNVSAALDARTTIKAACGMFHQNLPVLFLAQNESLRRAADPRSPSSGGRHRPDGQREHQAHGGNVSKILFAASCGSRPAGAQCIRCETFRTDGRSHGRGQGGIAWNRNHGAEKTRLEGVRSGKRDMVPSPVQGRGRNVEKPRLRQSSGVQRRGGIQAQPELGIQPALDLRRRSPVHASGP